MNKPLPWPWYLIVLLVIGLVVYQPNITNIGWETDDHSYITDNLEGHAFSPTLYGGRPVVTVFFWINYTLWGDNPLPFHVATVLLHVLAAFTLAYASWKGRHPSFLVDQIAGLLFLTACSHFRAVQWISAVGYPLALIFGLWALHFQRQQRPRLSLLFLGLSSLSHPGGIAFAILAFVDAYRVLPRQSWWRSWPSLAIPLTLVLFFWWLYPESPSAKNLVFLWYDPLKNLCLFASRLIFTSFLPIFAFHRVLEAELMIGGALVIFTVWQGWKKVSAHRALGWQWQSLWSSDGFKIAVLLLPFVFLPYWLTSAHSLAGPSRFLYFASGPLYVWLARTILSFSYKHLPLILVGALMALGGYTLRHTHHFSAYAEARGLHNNNIKPDVSRALFEFAAQGSDKVVPKENIYTLLSLIHAGNARACATWVDRGLEEFPDSPDLYVIYNALYSISDQASERWVAQRRLMNLSVDVRDPFQAKRSVLTLFYLYYNFANDPTLSETMARRAYNYALIFSGREDSFEVTIDQQDPFIEFFPNMKRKDGNLVPYEPASPF